MTLSVLAADSEEVRAGLLYLDRPGEPCQACGELWHYVLSVDAAMLFNKHHRCGIGIESCYLTPRHFITWRMP